MINAWFVLTIKRRMMDEGVVQILNIATATHVTATWLVIESGRKLPNLHTLHVQSKDYEIRGKGSEHRRAEGRIFRERA